MLALLALTEESFDFYVADGGNDAHAGTKGAPFATVDHAVSVLGAKQGVGISGDLFRLKPVTVEPEFFASLMLDQENQRLGVWGPQVPEARRPILTPGELVTGWSEIAVEGTGANAVVNGSMETWASATDAGTWAEAITTFGTVHREDALVHSGAHAMRFDIGSAEPNIVNADQLIAFASGQHFWLSLWSMITAAEHASTKVFGVELEIRSGTFTGYILQDDLTWAPVANRVNPSNHVGAYGQDFFTFAMPLGAGNVRLRLIRSDGGCSVYIDDVEMLAPVPGSGIYRAGVKPPTKPSLLTWDDGTGPIPLEEFAGASPDLPAMQWLYDATGHQVYINLSGTNPASGTVEMAVSNAIDVSAPGIRISGLEIRHGWDRSIRCRSAGFQMEDYAMRFCSSAGNAGCLALGASAEGERWSRISRGEYDFNSNDGIWFGLMPNLQIDFIRGARFDSVERVTPALSADVIQLSLQNGGDVGRLWVHDVYADQIGTLSPKGITIFHGDGDTVKPKEGEVIVERIVGILGNFGATAGMPGIVVRDCAFYWTSPERNWGGAVTSNEIDGHISDIDISDIIIIGPSPNGLGFGNGIAFEDGESWQHNVNIRDLLLINSGYSFLTLNSAELDGVIENIRMATIEGAPLPVHNEISLKHGPGSGKTLTLDHNVYPAEYANAFRGPAAAYATLAAWRAATGHDTHSVVEELVEKDVIDEFDAKLGRLTRRSVGTRMTYAEIKALVGV